MEIKTLMHRHLTTRSGSRSKVELSSLTHCNVRVIRHSIALTDCKIFLLQSRASEAKLDALPKLSSNCLSLRRTRKPNTFKQQVSLRHRPKKVRLILISVSGSTLRNHKPHQESPTCQTKRWWSPQKPLRQISGIEVYWRTLVQRLKVGWLLQILQHRRQKENFPKMVS